MNGSRTRLGKKSKLSGNKWKWTHNNPKPMGDSKGSPKREVNKAYIKKIEKSQINNLTLHLQEPEEQQQTKPRASRRKEVRSEHN